MEQGKSRVIDLSEHDDWFRDGANGRREVEAAFKDAFADGSEQVPIVHDGEVIGVLLSPEATENLMIAEVTEKLRGNAKLLMQVFRLIENEGQDQSPSS